MKTYFNPRRIAHILIAIISAILIGLAFIFPAVSTNKCHDGKGGTASKDCPGVDLYFQSMGEDSTTISMIDSERIFEVILSDSLPQKVRLPFLIFGYLSIITLIIACILVVVFVMSIWIRESVVASCCVAIFVMFVFFSCTTIGAAIISISMLVDEFTIVSDNVSAILIIVGGLLQLLQAFLISCFCIQSTQSSVVEEDIPQRDYENIPSDRRPSANTELEEVTVIRNDDVVTDIPQRIYENIPSDRRPSANTELEEVTVIRNDNLDIDDNPFTPKADEGPRVIAAKASDIFEANR